MLERTTPATPRDAVVFTGTWREFAPIALTNLALSVATLGLFRFWATARERRYLWSRTVFIDEPLEWAGTGRELFIGFLIVAAIIGVPLAVASLARQGFVFQGDDAAVFTLTAAINLLVFYLIMTGRFRALRYRLSRTYWRGIRGGSERAGWGYGVLAGGFWGVGVSSVGLGVPWVLGWLWNAKWRRMSVGPFAVHAAAHGGYVAGRWLALLILGVPIALIVAGLATAATAATALGRGGGLDHAVWILVVFAVTLLVPLFIGWLAVRAPFTRQAIGSMTIGDFGFTFDATWRDWVRLYLGNIALVVGTLGVGIVFIGYRHWRFHVHHLGATGTLPEDAITQSALAEQRQGEGLADAFDFGAV